MSPARAMAAKARSTSVSASQSSCREPESDYNHKRTGYSEDVRRLNQREDRHGENCNENHQGKEKDEARSRQEKEGRSGFARIRGEEGVKARDESAFQRSARACRGHLCFKMHCL